MRTPADKSRLQYRRWTASEIAYLKKNFRKMGDKEIAERLTAEVTTDGKVYKLKQVEKKRNYLGLHRTPDELKDIKARNTAAGSWRINHWKRWVDQQPIGTIVTWYNTPSRQTVYIKTATGYRKLAHFNWEEALGKIPKGMIIRHKDGNPLNCLLENLECVTRAEHGKRNALTDGRMAWELAAINPELKRELLKHPELLNLKRTLKQLNTEIRHARD